MSEETYIRLQCLRIAAKLLRGSPADQEDLLEAARALLDFVYADDDFNDGETMAEMIKDRAAADERIKSMLAEAA